VRIYGFITVRTTSSRLRRKCLLKFGEGNVLEHVIRRPKFFGFEPLICTTLAEEDNIIEEIEDLFIQNPDLHKINWFRKEEWKKGWQI